MQREKLSKEVLDNLYESYRCNHGDRIVNVLSMYRSGEYIYPDVIKRNLKLTDNSVVFEILDKLIEAGIAKKCFQYYCPCCGKTDGLFRTEDIEDDIYCNSCDNRLDKKDKRFSYLCL